MPTGPREEMTVSKGVQVQSGAGLRLEKGRARGLPKVNTSHFELSENPPCETQENGKHVPQSLYLIECPQCQWS